MPAVPYANFAEVLRSVSLTPDRSPADQAPQRRTHPKATLNEQAKDLPTHPIVKDTGHNRGSWPAQ
jgi:hypothetical protein